MAEITYKTETIFTLRVSEDELSYLQSALWAYKAQANRAQFPQEAIDSITALSNSVDEVDTRVNENG